MNMMLSRLLTVLGVEHLVWTCGFSSEDQWVFDVAIVSQNEHAMNTLSNSTCSHKWCDTSYVPIFGVKPCIPALSGSYYALV